jgi:hypothetical protein
MLSVYRTHSQTLGLYREQVDEHGRKYWVILEVAHVHNQAKLKEWRRRGAS